MESASINQRRAAEAAFLEFDAAAARAGVVPAGIPEAIDRWRARRREITITKLAGHEIAPVRQL